LPALQTSPVLHTTPHAPQFALSVSVDVHLPPQSIEGAGQLPRHFPSTQKSVALHAVPHAPQFALSVTTSTHLPEQSFSEALQVGPVSVLASEESGLTLVSTPESTIGVGLRSVVPPAAHAVTTPTIGTKSNLLDIFDLPETAVPRRLPPVERAYETVGGFAKSSESPIPA